MTFPDNFDINDDTGMWVCVTHRRFVPCRYDDPHEFSCADTDIERVRRYQNGEDGT